MIKDWKDVDNIVHEDHLTIWATTEPDDWCGEHPDFPEYLASLKANTPAADPAKIYLLHDIGSDMVVRAFRSLRALEDFAASRGMPRGDWQYEEVELDEGKPDQLNTPTADGARPR
jgi:hypothetical protein